MSIDSAWRVNFDDELINRLDEIESWIDGVEGDLRRLSVLVDCLLDTLDDWGVVLRPDEPEESEDMRTDRIRV